MIAQIWAVLAWVPLGIGLIALVTLAVLVTADFIPFYIKYRRDLTRSERN